MSDERTIAVYDRKAADYRRMMTADPSGDAALAEFVAAIPPGARVLDLGCGPGTWAGAMIAAGLEVDAIDASSAMVQEASRIEGLRVWQACIEDLDGENLYQGIWANFSLLHLPKSDMPNVLAALQRLLLPGGVMHFGLKEGQGEARDSLDRFYAYYTPQELTALLARLDLTVSGLRRGVDTGLDGTRAGWFTLLAHG
jgi:SAM-dependent methyltransferase